MATELSLEEARKRVVTALAAIEVQRQQHVDGEERRRLVCEERGLRCIPTAFTPTLAAEWDLMKARMAALEIAVAELAGMMAQSG